VSSLAPLPWYGGKQRLAQTIIDMIPSHSVYVEPFGGGGAVLLAKPTSGRVLDVYNDIDRELVGFFRTLRDRPLELQEALRLTPYARAEFEGIRDDAHWPDEPVERARRWFVRVRGSFACIPTGSGWGFETGGGRGGTHVGSFATAVDELHRFAERLRRVQIDCIGWQACIDRYDSPTTCFYLDPPYLMDVRQRSRRKDKLDYRNEISIEEHVAILTRLATVQGSVVISGYTHPLYEEMLADFERFEFDAFCHSAARDDGKRPSRVEVLWRRAREESQLRL